MKSKPTKNQLKKPVIAMIALTWVTKIVVVVNKINSPRYQKLIVFFIQNLTKFDYSIDASCYKIIISMALS